MSVSVPTPVQDMQPKKILFLGDDNIGKTTFIKKYCEYLNEFRKIDVSRGSFLTFDLFTYDQPIGDDLYPMQILDLPAGTTEESRIDQYPAEVHLIILCYAIDKPASLNNVAEIWLHECRLYFPAATLCFLVGLRKDLTKSMMMKNNEEIILESPRPIGEYVTWQSARDFHIRNLLRGDPEEVSVQEDPQGAFLLLESFIEIIFDCERFGLWDDKNVQ